MRYELTEAGRRELGGARVAARFLESDVCEGCGEPIALCRGETACKNECDACNDFAPQWCPVHGKGRR